jgi:hypothetical protein
LYAWQPHHLEAIAKRRIKTKTDPGLGTVLCVWNRVVLDFLINVVKLKIVKQQQPITNIWVKRKIKAPIPHAYNPSLGIRRI